MTSCPSYYSSSFENSKFIHLTNYALNSDDYKVLLKKVKQVKKAKQVRKWSH